MSNHFHLVAVPIQEDAAAKVLGRLESDYARFLNVRRRTSGHLWQARYHSVAMEAAHAGGRWHISNVTPFARV
jgi:putative transposase